MTFLLVLHGLMAGGTHNYREKRLAKTPNNNEILIFGNPATLSLFALLACHRDCRDYIITEQV
jgi:hypothetical protein